MDREILVEEIKKLGRMLDEREGPLTLLMLMSSDPGVVDDWNIIVSARGFNGLTRADAIRRLTDLLRSTVSRKIWPKIRRATVLRADDPFVQAINTLIAVENADANFVQCNVGGIEIPNAIVFTSKRVAA